MTKDEKVAEPKKPLPPVVLITTGLLLAFLGFIGISLLTAGGGDDAVTTVVGLALAAAGVWGVVRIFTGIIGFTVQQGNRYR